MTTALLHDDLLRQLALDPGKVQAIPCLAGVVTGKAEKPCNCKRKASPAPQVVNGEAARICIYQLPDDEMAKVKAAIGVERLIFYLKTPGFPPRAVR